MLQSLGSPVLNNVTVYCTFTGYSFQSPWWNLSVKLYRSISSCVESPMLDYGDTCYQWRWLTLGNKNPEYCWLPVLEENIESYPGTFRFGSFCDNVMGTSSKCLDSILLTSIVLWMRGVHNIITSSHSIEQIYTLLTPAECCTSCVHLNNLN